MRVMALISLLVLMYMLVLMSMLAPNHSVCLNENGDAQLGGMEAGIQTQGNGHRFSDA